MRLVIEAPNGRTYYGAPSNAMYFKESTREDEAPKLCENVHQVSNVLTKWIEDNPYSAFTLTTDKGDVYVFPSEILKRCIITIELQADAIKKYIPESVYNKMDVRGNPLMKREQLSGEHSSPGMGYEPEDIITELPMEAEETEEEDNDK